MPLHLLKTERTVYLVEIDKIFSWFLSAEIFLFAT